MNILNLYFSSTGNTEKVAQRITDRLKKLGHDVHTLKVRKKDVEVDPLKYDFIFAGSGVYFQLPGKPLMELFRRLLQSYSQSGEIKPGSPRRSSARAVIYCTYGGVHTGINEAIPAVKYMGQLFDHLGYDIVGEWYVIGEYLAERLQSHSVNGRLGDIRNRPNEADLSDVDQRVTGIMRM